MWFIEKKNGRYWKLGYKYGNGELGDDFVEVGPRFGCLRH